MRVSTRFPVAVHALMMITALSKEKKVTSELISESTGVNAVIIRKIFLNLKDAGLISVSPGPGGAKLSKSPDKITLWDIYMAAETENIHEIFKFHNNRSPHCPIGVNIYEILYSHLDKAIYALKKELSGVTLSQLLEELNNRLLVSDQN